MNRYLAFLAAALLAGCATLGMGGAAAPAKVADGVLTDSRGMTLYTFDRDNAAPGKSVCNGQCAANWPPLMAPAGAAAQGEYTLVTRDDGTKQWAYKGKPLYTWVKDQKAGDRSGDNVNNVWHVARP